MITQKNSQLIDVRGLLAVGGKASSGLRLDGLSKAEDYVVISPAGAGLSIVPLKGKSRAPRELEILSRCEVEDLILIPLPAIQEKSPAPESFPVTKLEEAIEEISSASDDATITAIVLRHVVAGCGYDRGLVIAKNPRGNFEVVAHQGTDPSAPWLSESLLAETLNSKKSVVVPNIVGSRFERNQSLIGTGFLSVAAWPLLWRGETVGAIIAGSSIPQPEKEIRNAFASVLSPLVAQYVSGWVKEKRLEEQLKRNLIQENDGPFLTESAQVNKMMDLARKLAPSDLSVLIQGETGVGKEVLAKWLHERSEHGKGAFIAVNCGAIPENLIESTLFGHKRGSFTGAIADQTGKFVLAHGGTIFLDEVADLPLSVQGKLLRVLQERVVEPVGAQKPISVHVRVLCASHKNLRKLVERGEFREDLYYRLAEVTLEIPPLRERPEDIILICQQYLRDNKIDKKISTGAWEWLPTQKWTGNVRELLSTLKRATLLSQTKELEIRDFLGTEPSAKEKSWLGAATLEDAVREFQQEKVKIALKLSEGNRKSAADLLGVNQRTLFRYLEDIREDV